MEIAKSTYYYSLINPLMRPDIKAKIKFSEDGFNYLNLTLSFTLHRQSKNKYFIFIIYSNKFEKREFSNLSNCVEYAVKLCYADLDGKFSSG